MGGQSVPSSTFQQQNLVTGAWAVPELKSRMIKLLDPSLKYLGEQQGMMIGVNKNDPAAMRQFLGLSSNAPVSDITSALKHYAPPTAADSTPYTPIPLGKGETKAAAQGGVMSLYDDEPRGFAKGGKPKSGFDASGNLTPEGYAFLQNKIASGGKPSAMYTSAMKKYEKAQTAAQTAANTDAIRQGKTDVGITPAGAFTGTAGYQGMTYDPKTGQWSVSNPALLQAEANLKAMQNAPSQFGQATDMYNQAASGLSGLAGYSPQQVAAQQAAAQQAQASLANRGDIRDVTANKAAVDQYTAAQMKAPEGVQAMGYEAAQMQGPSSWTEEGVAQKYMSPYMQNVIDVQKRQKAKDYAQQQNELNKQAMAAGAFGGGRQAMQRSQASRDYQQQLQDLEAIGMQKAYEQGMSQFGQESGLTQQARQSNQAALNAQKQQFVQNALQAALNNYGGQLTAEQQNMIAQNAASQFNSQALNTANLTYEQQRIAAQQMNQGADLQTALQNAQLATGVSQSNAQLGTQASLANASNALQAGIANQQAGLQANQQGIAAYGQMGNMAQGLGALGSALGNYNMGVTQGWGTLGQAQMNYAQNAANQQQTNNLNWLNAPTNLGGQGMNLISGAGSGSGGTAITQGKQGQ